MVVRRILMNLISSGPSGDLIIRGWHRSRGMLIQMMCFGVMFVWGVRDGKRSGIICVGFDELSTVYRKRFYYYWPSSWDKFENLIQ